MRDFFGVKCIVKTGVETFDTGFREKILQKGFGNASPEEIAEIFDSPCLLVGIQGQTREMIRNDIEIAQNLFDHFTVNVYINNSTPIKRDPSLVQWFEEEYAYLEGLEKCDILWNNTDFGVGD